MRDWRVLVALLVPLFVVSCTKKAEDATPPASVEAEVPKASLESLVAPPSVILFGGGASFDRVRNHLASLCRGVGLPACPLAGLAPEELGLASFDGLDFKKAFRFAVLDFNTHATTSPLVFEVAMTSKAAFIAALPKDKVASGDSFKLGGETYVSFAGDDAVFTFDPKAFAEIAPFAKALAGSTSSADAIAYVPMTNVQTLYGAEVKAGIANLKAVVGAQGAGNVGAIYDAIAVGLDDLERVAISATILDDGTAFRIEVTPKKGAPLEATFAGMKRNGSENKLLATFPDTSAFLAAKIDPTWGAKLTAGVLPPDPKLADAMNEYAKATSGEIVVGLATANGKSGALALSGLLDRDKAIAAQAAMLPLLTSPAMKAMQEKMHIKAVVQPKAYKVEGVDVMVTKNEMKDPRLAQLNAVSGLFGDQHTAIAKDTSAIAYGASARDLMTSYLQGKMSGGLDKSPALARVRKNGVADAFVVGSFRPSELLALATGAAAPPPGPGVGLSAGIVGLSFVTVVDVPSVELAPIAQGMMRLAAAGQAPPPTLSR